MIRIIWILLFEQFKGLFNNKKNFIKNTASKLAQINILYIKIFQALSSSNDKLTESDQEHFYQKVQRLVTLSRLKKVK